MPPKQEQTQKQTVVINLGDKVIKKRKRKAKPKKRKASTVQSIAYQEAVQGGLPPFIRTQMPTASNVQTDKVLFQLADVTKQLDQLQERQKHATGNLSGQAAIARQEAEQGSVVQSSAPELKPPPPPAVAKTKRRTAKEMGEAHSMLAEDKQKRPYVKRQTKAEQAATALMQQSAVVGGGRATSLADFDGGSGMSSLTMTPDLMSPKPKVGKKLTIVPELQASTPSTVSLAGGSAAEASAQTGPNF